MPRDLHETAARAREAIPINYDLRLDEVMTLVRQARGTPDDTIEAIMEAFRYGFVLGCRATARGKVKSV